MSKLLALDQGTTSCRAILFDERLQVLGVAQREFRQHYPRPGLVEHDAGEIWDCQLAVTREVLASTDTRAQEVAALGITNQRETTVVWERESGRPIGPAIVWQDRRTADWCERLRRSHDADRIRRITGLQLDPYFSASKLHWMLDHHAGARARAEAGELAFGTIDSWLVWNLTGGRRHATDASNASRTLLFDLERDRWSDWLLERFGIPASLLPEVVDSAGTVAETEPDLLGAPVPVAGIAGDQQSALFGQMCLQPGMAKNTYGTGCFLLMNTGSEPVRSRRGLLTTVAWRIGGHTTYALEGSVFIGGAAVQWLRDGLGIIDKASDVEALAASVADSGGVWFVPAFAGLGAPRWDPRARGTLLGITRGTTAAHLARATLEGIAHQVADVVEVMREEAGLELRELRVDGGAAANELLLRIQADLLQVPVARPANLETTALGAAALAGLGAGVWSGPEQMAAEWRSAGGAEPELDAAAVARLRESWSRAVDRSAGWVTGETAE